PLKGVLLSYSDTNAAREVKGSVERRGLCGDVFLVSTPSPARVTDVKVDTSVRQGKTTFSVGLEGLAADKRYAVRVKIGEPGHEITSQPFKPGAPADGRIFVSETRKPDKLWDIHTPQNQLTARVSLEEGPGALVDEFPPVRYGFREFWIDGRDFYLN